MRIEENEKDAVLYACALMTLQVEFFTCENMPGVIQAYILDRDGSEISPIMACHLGRQIELKIGFELAKQR